jgi:hypothetical protein
LQAEGRIVSERDGLDFMNSSVGLALLVGGIILMVFGFNASQSAGSEVSKFFTGNPSDRAMWMLIGGALATVIGVLTLWRGGRERP